jgi:hypothetical protein
MMNSMWNGIIEFIIGSRRSVEFHHREGEREAAAMERLRERAEMAGGLREFRPGTSGGLPGGGLA